MTIVYSLKNNTTSYSAILPTKHFLLIIEMLLLHYRHVFTLLSITITQIKTEADTSVFSITYFLEDNPSTNSPILF